MKSRREQARNINLKQRLATIGLFVVLLVLTLCSTGAIFIIWQATSQTSRTVTMSNLYQQTRYQILSQDTMLQAYIRLPYSVNKNAFLYAFQQSMAMLHHIEKVGDASDVAAVQPILIEQAYYFTSAQHMFALVDSHNLALANLFEDDTVGPIFNTISDQIGSDTDLYYNVSLQSLAQEETVLRFIFVAVTLIFVFGMFLIFLFLRILRRSQRQKYSIELAEQDMQRMANAQIQLLPRDLPAVPGLEMYASSHPAQEVGGDFYTFDKHDSGQYVLTIGDVSGKGLRAALLMAMVRTIVHLTVHALLQLEPNIIIGKVNQYLYDDFTEVGMFATVFVSCYDPATQSLTYTNAGHSPVIYCPAEGPARLLGADVSVIGIIPMLSGENTVVPLAPGDVLMMGTDGLSEAQNANGAMFGYERLLALIESTRQESAQDTAKALFAAVNRFAAGCEQFDDQTLVILKGVAR